MYRVLFYEIYHASVTPENTPKATQISLRSIDLRGVRSYSQQAVVSAGFHSTQPACSSDSTCLVGSSRPLCHHQVWFLLYWKVSSSISSLWLTLHTSALHHSNTPKYSYTPKYCFCTQRRRWHFKPPAHPEHTCMTGAGWVSGPGQITIRFTNIPSTHTNKHSLHTTNTPYPHTPHLNTPTTHTTPHTLISCTLQLNTEQEPQSHFPSTSS